jgi:hypothetical protein
LETTGLATFLEVHCKTQEESKMAGKYRGLFTRAESEEMEAQVSKDGQGSQRAIEAVDKERIASSYFIVENIEL